MKGAFTTRLGIFWFVALTVSPLAFSADSVEKGKADAPSMKDQKPVATKNAKPADPSASATDGLSSFCKLLPLGEKNQNVKIPSFTNGIRTSLINARTMTRVDDEHMEMEKMDILLKGDTDGKDLSVKMRTATFHMPTSVISSDQRSRVSRNDFQLEGDSLVFDTRTQQGKMVGHVEMIIFDADMLKSKSPDAAGAENKSKEKTEKTEAAPTSGATPNAESKETK